MKSADAALAITILNIVVAIIVVGGLWAPNTLAGACARVVFALSSN